MHLSIVAFPRQNLIVAFCLSITFHYKPLFGARGKGWGWPCSTVRRVTVKSTCTPWMEKVFVGFPMLLALVTPLHILFGIMDHRLPILPDFKHLISQGLDTEMSTNYPFIHFRIKCSLEDKLNNMWYPYGLWFVF